MFDLNSRSRWILLSPDMEYISGLIEKINDETAVQQLQTMRRARDQDRANAEAYFEQLGTLNFSGSLGAAMVVGDNGERYDRVAIQPTSIFEQNGYAYLTDGVFAFSPAEHRDILIEALERRVQAQ